MRSTLVLSDCRFKIQPAHSKCRISSSTANKRIALPNHSRLCSSALKWNPMHTRPDQHCFDLPQQNARKYTTIVYRNEEFDSSALPRVCTTILSASLGAGSLFSNDDSVYDTDFVRQISPIAQSVFAVIRRIRPSVAAHLVATSPLISGPHNDLRIRIPVPGDRRGDHLELFTTFTPHTCRHELVVRLWGFEQREQLAPLEDDRFNDFIVQIVLSTVDDIMLERKKIVCIQDGDADFDCGVRAALLDARESLHEPSLVSQLLRHCNGDFHAMRQPVIVARSWSGRHDEIVFVPTHSEIPA